MTTVSLQHLNYFEIYDELNRITCYGCDQEWYRSRWQRLSGCGPTAVTNTVLYRNRASSGSQEEIPPVTKADSLKRMEEVWGYVTPSVHGIHTTKMLCDGARAYAKAKGMTLRLDALDIPKDPAQRPTAEKMVSFLANALANDAPVAFLNLHNGTVAELDAWHWVTIISMEYISSGSAATIEFLDEAKIKKIDLMQWYHTTTMGGGFVSIL